MLDTTPDLNLSAHVPFLIYKPEPIVGLGREYIRI